jgi:hypothetical protein
MIDNSLIIEKSYFSVWEMYVCVRPMDSLPKACFNISKVSVKVFPSLTQNLTHILAAHGILSFCKTKKLPNAPNTHSLKDA